MLRLASCLLFSCPHSLCQPPNHRGTLEWLGLELGRPSWPISGLALLEGLVA